MCEIATNSDPFSERLERRAIRTSSLIVELKMSMNKIANRLDPFPSRSGLPKVKPGKVHQLAVNFTVPAGQQKSEQRSGQFADLQLLRLRCVGIGFAVVTDDGLAKQAERAARGIDAAAVIAESVIVLFDGEIWIGRKVFGFNEM